MKAREWFDLTMNEFTKKIYDVVRDIPEGIVLSYGQVARLAGNPRGARAVGFAMRRVPYEWSLPCHRVVFSDGSLCAGDMFGGNDAQRRMLEAEGVIFSENGKVNMKVSGIC